MYDQTQEDTIFIMLYAVVMTMALVASAYLLLRRGNAFSRRIKTPRRLRRWTAAFFGIMTAGHLWYLPGVMMADGDAAALCLMIGALLDCLLTIPLALVVMLCMLQDRRRPLWPVAVMMAPLAVGMVACIVSRSDTLLPWLRGYFLLMTVGFTVYMVREVQRYGRWLRDNYADLEHKEVWQSLLVLAAIVLMFGYYVSGDSGMAYEYIIQICGLLLIGFLLWRVETLQDLTIALPVVSEEIAGPVPDDIERLLRERCEATQLYLQRDLTVSQLAQALGINRFYLSQYFSRKDTTYNTYINELRIAHFERLYREAVSAQRPVSAKQLAARSGYRSYSTFSLAFKQRTGLSVTAWMNAEGG